MEKISIIIFLFLFGCNSDSVNPSYKDLEIIVNNTDFAEICLYENDSIFTACEDFDREYVESIHLSNIDEGNYLLKGKAGKIKRQERFYYNGKSHSVSITF